MRGISNWETVNRPGYLGKRRDEAHKDWDCSFGPGRWRLAWTLGDIVLERPLALQVYEDAFYVAAVKEPKLVEFLTAYKECYDTAPSNVEAGLSYDVQETPSNHLHDVAWRRVLARLGRRFEGNVNRLLHIRWKESEGYLLNPGIISFHLPRLIESPTPGEKEPWWYEGTVEDWYQRNKVLQVKVQ